MKFENIRTLFHAYFLFHTVKIYCGSRQQFLTQLPFPTLQNSIKEQFVLSTTSSFTSKLNNLYQTSSYIQFGKITFLSSMTFRLLNSKFQYPIFHFVNWQYYVCSIAFVLILFLCLSGTRGVLASSYLFDYTFSSALFSLLFLILALLKSLFLVSFSCLFKNSVFHHPVNNFCCKCMLHLFNFYLHFKLPFKTPDTQSSAS